jgi:hypothetical protein
MRRFIKTRIVPVEAQARLDAIKYEWSLVEDAASAILHIAAEKSVTGTWFVLLDFQNRRCKPFLLNLTADEAPTKVDHLLSFREAWIHEATPMPTRTTSSQVTRCSRGKLMQEFVRRSEGSWDRAMAEIISVVMILPRSLRIILGLRKMTNILVSNPVIFRIMHRLGASSRDSRRVSRFCSPGKQLLYSLEDV